MLKKTITYTNPFTDQVMTEDHYFHISKADLVEMEIEEHGLVYKSKDGEELTGMRARLQKISDSEDGKAIIAEIKEMIRRSYGVKQGDRFLKTQEAWDDFSSSEAFSQLLFELCTDAVAAGEFMGGLVPNNLDQIAEEIRAKAAQAELTQTAQAPNGDESKAEPRLLTREEMTEMDAEDLTSGLAEGRYKLT